MAKKNVVTYINKETGKLEKLDTETGLIFKPDEFYTPKKKKKYNLEDAAKICALLRSGYPIASLGEKQGVPDVETIYFWKRNHPDFALAIKEARECAAEAYASKAVNVAENLEGATKDEVAVARLQVDTYKWVAEKMNPDIYGNRTKVSGDSEQPLTIIVDTGIKRS